MPQTLLTSALAWSLLLSAARPSDAATVLIDFGKTDQETITYLGQTWNNITGPPALDEGTDFDGGDILLTNAVTTSNAATGIDFSVLDTFGGANRLGIGGSDSPAADGTALGYPQSATRDQMFSAIGTTAVLRLSDLATDGTTYDLMMFGTLDGAGTRTSRWTVGGVTKTLDVNNNEDTVVQFLNLVPDSNGWINITYTGGSGEPGLWSVLEIDIHPVPEPSTWGLLLGALVAVGAGRRLRQRRGATAGLPSSALGEHRLADPFRPGKR